MHADIDWNTVAPEFEWNGSLRDLYVQDASAVDWHVVLDAVRASYPPLTFLANGVAAPLPTNVEEVFALWAQGATPVLGFWVGGVHVACHFFTLEEIEFDIDPRDLTGPEPLQAVLAFLGALATLTGKPAVLTPENMSEEPIFRADPATGDVEYVPPSSRPAA